MKPTISAAFFHPRQLLRGTLLFLAFIAGPGSLHAAAPSILPIAPQSVPCGKTLVVPVTANGNGPLNFTVTSSNPKLIPLLKTGNPFLKMHVTYAGDNGTNLAFYGDLIFQLFRDMAPKTVGYISGFAQAGYYDNVLKVHSSGTAALSTGTYNSSTFHRIAQLDTSSTNSFIAQGGDPDANDYRSSSVEYASLPHGPGYQFDNEFSSPLIFTGKGQLAMANSNGTAGYQGTNGSQFFITNGPLRFLDFNHTIFGQLVRDDGAILDKIMAVPVASSRPTVDVVIESAALVEDNTDAVLLVSSTGMGTAQITVTARDIDGNTASQTFSASTFADMVNDPPILRPVANVVAPLKKTARLTIAVDDLEGDYIFPSATFLSNAAQAGGKLDKNIVSIIPSASAPIGKTLVGIDALQYGPVLRSGSADHAEVVVGLGVRTLSPLPTPVLAAPNVPISNRIVAAFRAAQVSGSSGAFGGTINWGDGTSIDSGTHVVIASGTSPANSFTVAGSHTYSRPGQYTLIVTATDSIGASLTTSNPVTISDGSLCGTGRDLVSGGAVISREIASFTDRSSAANPSAALIDWGDGSRTSGVLRKTESGFSVIGTHKYAANARYATEVSVTGTSPGDAAEAWGSVQVKGVIAPKLPPFPLTHIVGAIGSVAKRPDLALNTSVYVINCGTKDSDLVTLRFYLSDDLSTPLRVASFVRPLRLPQNRGASFAVTNIIIPPGTTTKDKQLVMEIVYSDPIGDHMNIPRFFYSNTLP